MPHALGLLQCEAKVVSSASVVSFVAGKETLVVGHAKDAVAVMGKVVGNRCEQMFCFS